MDTCQLALASIQILSEIFFAMLKIMISHSHKLEQKSMFI